MKLSIITIHYNNYSGLRKTVESVSAQSARDFEYLVIDGGSVDGSKDYLQSLALSNDLSHFQYVSEADNGIYHAMNKGLRLAKGEYVHFLNSGDWLVDADVVATMLGELYALVDSGRTPDVFVGNKISVRPNGQMFYNRVVQKEVTAYTFYRGTVEHTSAYIRRAMFEKVGEYDEYLRIVSDWKWYLEALVQHNAIFEYTDVYVSYFDTTGISSVNLSLDKEERRKVLEDVFHPAILADYDRFYLAIDQYERLRRYSLFYWMFYFVERVLFKFEKWKMNLFGWKSE